MDFVMILQLLIVLGALYVGSRYGSLALGAISGIGLAILVLGFGMKPGNPPSDIATVNFDRSGTDPPLMMPGQHHRGIGHYNDILLMTQLL